MWSKLKLPVEFDFEETREKNKEGVTQCKKD